MATSSDIGRITEEQIVNVRISFLKSKLRKSIDDKCDQVLLTKDEYLDVISDSDTNAKDLYSTDQELFDDLLKTKKTKHYRQLQLLAERHAYPTMKLRFIHKPLSFMFLVEGSQNYYLVWETIDTEEATYVWATQKDIKLLKEKFEGIATVIEDILEKGKLEYLNTEKDNVQRIFHDYSDEKQGFEKWKSDFEKIWG